MLIPDSQDEGYMYTYVYVYICFFMHLWSVLSDCVNSGYIFLPQVWPWAATYQHSSQQNLPPLGPSSLRGRRALVPLTCNKAMRTSKNWPRGGFQPARGGVPPAGEGFEFLEFLASSNSGWRRITVIYSAWIRFFVLIFLMELNYINWPAFL